MSSSTGDGAALLRVTEVSKRYGGVHALRSASLTVQRPGEVHALVGANGSGKSTLLGVLSGQTFPDGGQLSIAGEPVVLGSTHAALAQGIVMVSQETAVAGSLTVAENVLLGHRQVRGARGIDWTATHIKAAKILHRLNLDIDTRARVDTLTPDQQQLVEIARALSTDARLVILDEPTSSLTDDQVEGLTTAVRRLSSEGVAVLLVSHRFAELYELCSRATVLRDGQTVLAASLADATPADLVDAMTGGAREALAPARRRAAIDSSPEQASALTVRGLCVDRRVHDVDLDVAPGEIVGLAGLVGSGRSELLEAVFGARPAALGTVTVGGAQIRRPTPRTMIEHGAGYLPPDRKVQGLVLKQGIGINLVMVRDIRKRRLGVPKRATERVAASTTGGRMRLKFGALTDPVSTLSGGNQQKVAIGKWLAAGVKVLLLDEPTRGVDVSAKVEIHGLLRELADSGTGILVSSAENEELLGLCDRVYVLSRGRVVEKLTAPNISDAQIVAAMGGHQ